MAVSRFYIFHQEECEMNRIYRKNEVTFAVIMILIYVLGTTAAESISAYIGIFKLVPAVFHVILTMILLIWVIKNGHTEKYGLVLPRYNISKAWFFTPLAIIAFAGLFFGTKLQYGPSETVFFVVSMLCVGFLEELIFRGFLFAGMAKKNLRSAIIVSSVTFGIGHIVNLLNGKPLVETLAQILFAIMVGFTLVILFYKGKSLVPCIVFHSLNNALSAFGMTNEEAAGALHMSTEQFEMIYVIILIVILAVYSFAMSKKLEVPQE